MSSLPSMPNATKTSHPLHDEKITDLLYVNNIIMIFHWIIFSILCQSIVILGTGANIINIICFVKQGFNDSVNVSLLGLAVADLGCLLTLVWTNISLNPSFMALDLTFIPMEVQYLTAGMPHTTFCNVSSWVTAVITLERCLCITAPLQVKNIITPKRMFVVIICLFIVLLSSLTPVYFVDKLDMKWVPDRNRSLIGLVRIENIEEVDTVSSAVINIFIPFSSFVVIITCTIILVIHLDRKRKWRKTSTASTQADTISSRNRKVSKMVVMISTLFIVCFIPLRILFIGMLMIPGFSLYGKYRPFLIIIAGFGVVLESLNSSLNIIFYFQMSSKYRQILQQLFKLRKQA